MNKAYIDQIDQAKKDMWIINHDLRVATIIKKIKLLIEFKKLNKDRQKIIKEFRNNYLTDKEYIAYFNSYLKGEESQ